MRYVVLRDDIRRASYTCVHRRAVGLSVRTARATADQVHYQVRSQTGRRIDSTDPEGEGRATQPPDTCDFWGLDLGADGQAACSATGSVHYF